ncbi:hypothetical protein JCM5296_001395 [Sporobolomyces johnsonii]
MADLVAWGLALVIHRVNDKVCDLRSPLLPPRPTSSIGTLDASPSSPSIRSKRVPLTEHHLKTLHLAWKERYSALYLRLCALFSAQAKGLKQCWAGKVDWEGLSELREAILEAEWVEKRLKEAVTWCEAQGVQRLPLSGIVPRGRRRSNSNPRPQHTDFPPSLLDLPYPLPPAPSPRITARSVPIPPSPDAYEHGPESPPSYRKNHDPFKERVLHPARWTREGRQWGEAA